MKRIFVCLLMLFSVALLLFAQDEEAQVFKLTGNLNAIYTLGNASKDQMLGTGTGPGAYEEQKNGYFLETNLYVLLKPVSFLEGYFKLYAIARPGSFYVPLSLESKTEQNFGFSLDRMYVKVSVFDALDLSLPVELYLKTGKYKGEASRYHVISKSGLENILFRMETVSTYNYEVEAAYKPLNNDFTISANFLSNYRFDEAIPRLYDNDGGVSDHGMPVLGEYAPQFIASLRFKDVDLADSRLNAEVIYSQNIADIYSGHSVGVDAGYSVPIKGTMGNTLSIPLGLGFVWHEKNIDLLSRTASYEQGKETISFRNTLSAALAVGARFKTGNIGLDGNLAGIFTHIEHIYRDPLQVISAALEVQLTFLDRYFLGGGFVAGTLADTRWKTKDDPKYGPLDGGGFDRTFSFADNFGYEVYGGINLWNNCRFVIGFNQNKGIAMNYNLENKPEGQMKYRLAGSELSDPQYEAGGFYLKFLMNL